MQNQDEASFQYALAWKGNLDINPPALEATVLALIYENSLEGAGLLNRGICCSTRAQLMSICRT